MEAPEPDQDRARRAGPDRVGWVGRQGQAPPQRMRGGACRVGHPHPYALRMPDPIRGGPTPRTDCPGGAEASASRGRRQLVTRYLSHLEVTYQAFLTVWLTAAPTGSPGEARPSGSPPIAAAGHRPVPGLPPGRGGGPRVRSLPRWAVSPQSPSWLSRRGATSRCSSSALLRRQDRDLGAADDDPQRPPAGRLGNRVELPDDRGAPPSGCIDDRAVAHLYPQNGCNRAYATDDPTRTGWTCNALLPSSRPDGQSPASQTSRRALSRQPQVGLPRGPRTTGPPRGLGTPLVAARELVVTPLARFLRPAAVTRASRHDNPAGARPQAVCVEAVTDGGVAQRRGPRRRTGLPRHRTRRHLRPGRDGADHDRAGTEHRDGKCGGQDDSLTSGTHRALVRGRLGGRRRRDREGTRSRRRACARRGPDLALARAARSRRCSAGCRSGVGERTQPITRGRSAGLQRGRTGAIRADRNVVTGLGRRGGARRPPQTRPRGPCAMCCV